MRLLRWQGHISLLGLGELISGSRLLRKSLRITLLGITALRITLLGIALLRITLLRIALLRVLTGSVGLLWIALLWILLPLGIALLRITLLWILLPLGIALLRIALLWILLPLGILPSSVGLLRIALLTRLHAWLAAKLGHHLSDDTTQHATSHGSCHRVHATHRVHAGLAIILLLIAGLSILSGD